MQKKFLQTLAVVCITFGGTNLEAREVDNCYIPCRDECGIATYKQPTPPQNNCYKACMKLCMGLP